MREDYKATGYHLTGRNPYPEVLIAAELFKESKGRNSLNDDKLRKVDARTLMENVALFPSPPEKVDDSVLLSNIVRLVLDPSIKPLETK